MSNQDVPRRSFLKLAALGAVGAALTECGTANSHPRPARLRVTQDDRGCRS